MLFSFPFRRAGLALLVAAAPFAAASAQTLAPPPPPLRPSGELLQEGIAAHDKEDYATAIARYLLVPSGDSSYGHAQAELALSYHTNKQHAEAVAAARRALDRGFYTPQLYTTLASAEESLEHYDRAKAIYAEGMEHFPYSHTLWFNQGVMHFRQHQAAESLTSLERALELQPGHPGTHLLLGYLEASQNHPAHAMLGLMTFLAIEPSSSRSNGVLANLEGLATGTFEVEAADRLKPTSPNEPFQELDLLLTSKVALRSDYKTRVKFDANLVKQIQLLVEKFPTGAALPATDLWGRAYGPLVEVLRREEYLTPFTYLILSSANNPAAAQWVKSNSGKIDKMIAAVQPALMGIRNQQVVARPGQTARLKGWFIDNGTIAGLGEGELVNGKAVLRGEWIMINENGGVSTEGSFGPDGTKTGRWRSYHPNGKLAKEAEYVKGEYEGPWKEYFDNGVLSVDATYRAGEAEGEAKLYYLCGSLREVRTYRQGKIEGEAKELYTNGQLRRRSTYVADQKQGPETGYYPDGTPEYEYVYAADQKHGAFTVYYPDKQVERKGTYDHGELHGAYTDYFPNGQVDETGSFTKGKRTGAWKQFYRWGKLSAEKSYDATGELTGSYKDYDQEGRLLSTMEYQQGRVTRVTYLDSRTGKQVAQTEVKKKGLTPVKGYHFDVSLAFTGTYRDGRLDGEWRLQHRNGQLQSVRRFAAGRLQGLTEEYFSNGQLRARQEFKDDQPHGYYQTFTKAGQPEQAGYYVQGQRAGTWRDYYSDGRVSQEIDYLNDEPSGVSRTFTPTGQLTAEYTYENGRITRLVTYDSTRAERDRVQIGPDTKEYVLTYPNGKPRTTVQIGCMGSEGPTTWLSPEGKPQSVTAMRFDERTGPYTGYHPTTGKVVAEGSYRNGRRDGEWKTYFPAGTLRTQGTLRAGQQEGAWLYYADNGKIIQEEHYMAGEVDGPLRVYNYAGELLVEKRFEHGELTGYRGPGADNKPTGEYVPVPPAGAEIRTQFANGKPALEETYRNGLLEGPRMFYYSSGQLYRRTAYSAGLLHGNDVVFYPTGKPMEEETYRNGEQEGLNWYYRADGTLERSETYRCGEKAGPTTYYDAQGRPTGTHIYWNAYVYGSK